MKKPTFACPLAGLAVILAPSVAQAATFSVNSTLDAVDAIPGDGLCATAGGVCTLRAAIQEANALAGAHTIMVPAGTYTLTIRRVFLNDAATGDLDISSNVIIQGAGADVTTVRSAVFDRVFEVMPSGNATLRGLRITGGSPGGDPSFGGGVFVDGVVVIDQCAVVGNTSGLGGGVFSSLTGTATITNSTIAGNEAIINGGGIDLEHGGTLANVTISGNSAAFIGGARIVFGTATLTNVTIASNRDTLGPGATNLFVGGSPITLRNMLTVASQPGLNCFIDFGSTLVDGGGNFAAGAPCGAIPANAAVGANLGPLTVNAPGKTATHALLPGNPAIGGGVACLATDQRGVSRVGTACDSGAYQLSTSPIPPTPPAPPIPPTPPSGPTVPPTISAIPDQVLRQNVGVTIPFTISGAIIAYALGHTTNPTLFPSLASSISCDQLGHCALQLTPADGRSGSGAITVTVSDGTTATTASFTATVVAVRPTAPGSVSAASVGSGLTLTWSPPDTGAPLAYVLSWGTSVGGANLPVQLIPGSVTRFDIAALPSGTYFLRLSAIGTDDVGPAAAEQPVTVAGSGSVPGPPVGLELAATAEGLRAAWHVPTIGATPTIYEEQVGTAPGLNDVVSPTERDVAHTERVAPGAYWVRVRAAAGGAAGAWSSSVQIPMGAGGCTTAPAAPILLPAMLTPGAATFTWIPGGGTAARYQMRVSAGAGLPATVLLTSAGAGTSGTWMAPAGAWAGRLVAVNACGMSAASNEIRFVVQP
ncbi:MAG TPA: fibronectin type III domain-containing protein [Vicinamibacterales bacterium]|nr:fibronectin type III domain-containing protein [Vicinamibacterales bacterium]